MLTDSLPVEQDMPVIITQARFAVSVQAVALQNFDGRSLSFDLGETFDTPNQVISNTTLNIDGDRPTTRRRTPTAALNLPPNLFNSLTATGNATTARITNSVYSTDSLFVRRDINNLRVGSIIIAAGITGRTIRDLDPPIVLMFTQKPVSSIKIKTKSCKIIRISFSPLG